MRSVQKTFPQIQPNCDSRLRTLCICRNLYNYYLKRQELYSQTYDKVGVMFAACPNFNDFYTENPINNNGLECIRVLNEIISDYDDLLAEHRFSRITKIKSIGSTYMTASGMTADCAVSKVRLPVCLNVPYPLMFTIADSLHFLHVYVRVYVIAFAHASGFSLLLRFPLATMLTFCMIIRKRDHKKILKRLICRCHRLIDMLIEFSQSLIHITHLKCLNVPYPLMFSL